jgi:transcriptional regulator with XRE-family HTH domain
VFGQRVKTLREQRGLTQQQLADAAGLTNDTISNYERGRRTDPPVSVVYAVAYALEVTIEDLLTDPQPEPEVTATP